MISAAISEKGAPWEVLRRWIAGEFDLVVSPRLLYELQTVLAREKFRRYFTYDEATEYVSWLHHEAEVVRDPPENPERTPRLVYKGLSAYSGASSILRLSCKSGEKESRRADSNR